MVSTIVVISVNLHGNRLIHPFSLAQRSDRDGGGMPRPKPAITETLTPRP
jgi:hypothetical protein